MKLHRFLFLTLLVLLIAGSGHTENEKDWMPDPNLRRVVRAKLQVPDHRPLRTSDMQHLYDLVSVNDTFTLQWSAMSVENKE